MAALVIIIIVAPVLPFPYPKSFFLPWSSTCIGAVGNEPRVLAFVSLTFLFFQKGVAVIPQSSSPVQFQQSYLPSGEICG